MPGPQAQARPRRALWQKEPEVISLGVDIGGTGAKCVAFNGEGAQLAISYIEYQKAPGETTLGAGMLAETAIEVIARCVFQLPDKSRVAAVTVSSFGESFVPLDREGNALTDIIMYFADTRSREFSDLVSRVGEETVMRITGTKPDSFYSLSKMLHTRGIVKKPVWKYLLISSYICWVLSGETLIDIALACRTLLFDVNTRKWSQTLLAASGFTEDQLPAAVPAGTTAGPLRGELAARLGLPPTVRVVVGTHDQVANALACGVAVPGDAADVTGTTESIAPLFPEIPAGFGFQRSNYACVPYLNTAAFVTYAYNLSGGAALRWFRDTFAAHLRQEAEEKNLSLYDLLNGLAEGEPDGLLFLPFLQGIGGTPIMVPEARGMWYGLSMGTTLPCMYRAIMEGLTFEMACNLEALASFGVRPKRLFACGGGARSRLWLQIKADIWERDIIPVRTEETGALGSAILGFSNLLGEKDLRALAARFSRHGEPVRPEPQRSAVYRDKMARYRRLRDDIIRETTFEEGTAT